MNSQPPKPTDNPAGPDGVRSGGKPSAEQRAMYILALSKNMKHAELTALIQSNDQLKEWIAKSNTAQYAMQLENERDELKRENDSLREKSVEAAEALNMAINTVECDSLDAYGHELPWYTRAKKAIAAIQNARRGEG